MRAALFLAAVLLLVMPPPMRRSTPRYALPAAPPARFPTWLIDSLSHPVDVHVYPDEDWRPHVPARDCWCHPEEDPLDVCVLHHNSLDGRERHEHGFH